MIPLSKVNLFIKDLQKFLFFSKRKPYISYWGELYFILYSIKKLAHASETPLFVYDIHPVGEIVYDVNNHCFVAQLPGLSIKLQDEEFVDALLEERLLPKFYTEVR